VEGAGSDCGRRDPLWTEAARQSAAFDELVEVLAAGVADELSFDDDDDDDDDEEEEVDDPFEEEEAFSDVDAVLRLSVR
jgi:hypothetical protein